MEKPDFLVEQFWLSFKDSLYNFYSKCPLNRPINLWSMNLNNLQSQKKYQEIEKLIRDYLILVSIDMMRHGDQYHTNILNSNIKRWNKISEKFSWRETNINNYSNKVFCLFSIYNLLLKKKCQDKSLELFQQVEIYLLNNNYSNLLKYAIETNQGSIIDKIWKVHDITKLINELYNVKLSNKIKGKKLINLIKNL